MSPAEKKLIAEALSLGAFDDCEPYRDFNAAVLAVKRERLEQLRPEWKEELGRKHYERWTARYRYRDERARMVAHVGEEVVQELEAQWRREGQTGPCD